MIMCTSLCVHVMEEVAGRLLASFSPALALRREVAMLGNPMWQGTAGDPKSLRMVSCRKVKPLGPQPQGTEFWAGLGGALLLRAFG